MISCRYCGANNEDSAKTCIRCQSAFVTPPSPDKQSTLRFNDPPPSLKPIQNYLVPSILSLLFCCQPFGLIALIYSLQVDSRQRLGDLYGAMDAAEKAKGWCWAAFWSAIAILILSFLAGLLQPRSSFSFDPFSVGN